MKLHHLNASRSQRIVWLIQELGADVEIVHHERDATTRLAPSVLLDLHPMGKSPLLEDGETVIAETGAIAQYLLARFDTDHALHPRADDADFPRYLEWMHAAEGSVFLPGLFSFYLMNAQLTEHPLAAMLGAEAAKAAGAIETHLSQHAYFAGERFSAADCLMGFQVQNTAMRGSLDATPATKAWLETVQARPAYKRMLEIGV